MAIMRADVMFTATRRSFLLGLVIAGGATFDFVRAATPTMVVNKDPNCGCCSGWVEHVRVAGFDARVNEVIDLAPLKSQLSIPSALASCHTAHIEGYVIEGHVPASAIKRLLSERPSALGLAVAGMSAGSPGMEVPGAPDEVFHVVLFGPFGQRVYAKFKGAQELL
jgi:hypothetical protein